MTTAIEYTPTTYSDGEGREYAAVQIDWTDVTAALGHEHRGTPADDRALADALIASGAPAWVSDPDVRAGWVDVFGWGLYCTLRADRVNDGWTVVDQSGARWCPHGRLDRDLERSEDPEATAIAMCIAEPMRGTWTA